MPLARCGIGLSVASADKFCFVWGPDLALAERWLPLKAGSGHGRPERAPGRCVCAVTSLLQRDGGGAVC